MFTYTRSMYISLWHVSSKVSSTMGFFTVKIICFTYMLEVNTDNISGQYSIMDYFLIEYILHEVLFCFANNIWYINKRIKWNYWNIIPGSILMATNGY